MRQLKDSELKSVSGAYSDNILANIAEGTVCAIGGAVLGAWTMAILGGRGASSKDVIGIGGGITAVIGMFGGALTGAVAGAFYGPYIGYDAGLVMAEGLLLDIMKGLPGA
ncbi:MULTISPECIES: hypothetical protein [Pantoea]|jgi:hypothetical protein|uniref:hypothetical protein n=1 Tax=Pantoea TaxID=53335 RepID=UPI001F4735F5|nr:MULTISPECIES: hypothetical protein [Pantoea]UIL52625.1 hypothetical protein LZU96_01235 [Pantoea agglomerans]